MDRAILSEDERKVLAGAVRKRGKPYRVQGRARLAAAERLARLGLLEIVERKERTPRCGVTEKAMELYRNLEARSAVRPVEPRSAGPSGDLAARLARVESLLSEVLSAIDRLSRDLGSRMDAIAEELKRIKVEERAVPALEGAVRRLSGPGGGAPLPGVLDAVSRGLGVGRDYLADLVAGLESRGVCELAPGGKEEIPLGGRYVGLIRWKGG
ncbi:MAG: hypothetical protein DRO06_01940 [Thermoproteota archaeon]|nr:MAG: hypothetical protein DRO06_01940 [Candidatus Korarchaeota archaeon]